MRRAAARALRAAAAQAPHPSQARPPRAPLATPPCPDDRVAQRLFSAGGKKTGFEGFRPKAPKGERDSSNKTEPSSSDASPQQLLLTGGLGLLALASLFVGRTDPVQEISFQEFRTGLLERGAVQRVEVSNKAVAKVFVRPTFSAGELLRHPAASGADEGGFARQAFGSTPAPSGGARPQPQQQPPSLAPPPSSQPGVLRFRFSIGSVEAFERKLEEAQASAGLPPSAFVPVTYTTDVSWSTEALRLLPTALLLGAYVWFTRRQFGGGGFGGGGGAGGLGGGGGRNIFSVGKANVTTLDKQKRVTFADVAGCDEAKAEVAELVHFLKHPKKYAALGATIPRGALLVGPPGTGKTLLARAVAGEAGVPFLSMSGSEFQEMFVGVGSSRVRDLFAQARAKAPSIIFIDEIDAIGRARGRAGFPGGNDERENTLNQLLVEMDGFGTTAGVVVLAGTNRADVLDRALLRPGRFDRQISVDRPDVAGREQILAVHLAKVKLAGSEAERTHVATRVAALTPGFAGADLANVVNEAALTAARRDGTSVLLADLESAIDRVIGGLEKKHKVVSPEERRTVAYHEAGHAVAGWFLEHAEPLLKVSIVPRGAAALGFAQYLPSENLLATDAQLADQLCMTLGGRAAEEVVFGFASTGAQNDLERVTKLAYARVAVYGMNKRVGLLSFPPDDGSRMDRPYSQATGAIIDEEVRALVQAAYDRTLALLTEKRGAVEALAQALLAKEVLGREELTAVLGERPFARPAGSAPRNIDRYMSKAPPAPPPPPAETAEEEQGGAAPGGGAGGRPAEAAAAGAGAGAGAGAAAEDEPGLAPIPTAT